MTNGFTPAHSPFDQYFFGCLFLCFWRWRQVSITIKTKTRNPTPNRSTTPGRFSHICLTPFVSWDQFMCWDDTPQITKNKLGFYPTIFRGIAPKPPEGGTTNGNTIRETKKRLHSEPQ